MITQENESTKGMTTTYRVFLLGYAGKLELLWWPGDEAAGIFEAEAFAVVAVRNRIEKDKLANNNFRYVVLPVYSQP